MRTSDYVGVSCQRYRESLSARVDGEPGELPDAVVDQHLTTCVDCSQWYEHAVALRRSMLVREAARVPDLTGAILDYVPAPTGERWGTRGALGAVALAQCGLGFAQLFGVSAMGAMVGADAADGMLGHLGGESAAWNLAAGIGLLWAAVRVRAAGPQLPLLAGFVLVLGLVSAHDLVTGHVQVQRVATHLLLAVGVVLVWVVHRQHRDDPVPGPAGRGSLDEDLLPRADASDEYPIERRARGNRDSWRRPASKHRAA